MLIYKDDGIGIPQDKKELIFERGYTTSSGSGKSSGLGLFLARDILAISGIAIKETGVPGAGSGSRCLSPPGSGGAGRQNNCDALCEEFCAETLQIHLRDITYSVNRSPDWSADPTSLFWNWWETSFTSFSEKSLMHNKGGSPSPPSLHFLNRGSPPPLVCVNVGGTPMGFGCQKTGH